MFRLFKYFINQFTQGFKLPLAHDADTKRPSATLWFAYIAFFMALGSVMNLTMHGDAFIAACTSIAFWAIATVFYRMRKISKIKVDLDDKELEVDGDNGETDGKTN